MVKMFQTKVEDITVKYIFRFTVFGIRYFLNTAEIIFFQKSPEYLFPVRCDDQR